MTRRAGQVASLLLLCFTLSGCVPAPDGGSWGRPISRNETPLNDPGALIFDFPERLPVRGDPEFDATMLPEEVRQWHSRLLAAANHDEQVLDAAELAHSDDAYQYGRALYTHNQSLLLGLRVTGDLRFLDAVDRNTEVMRDQLEDSWCGGVEDEVYVGRYETVEGSDGYLNFRRRYEEGETYCRDSSDLEEAMVHGHLAMVMHAFHVNRDLASPSGVDYGERADFWLDYLRNHFEAKWRERSGTRFPRMDFIDLKFCHTYATFLLYYYYLGTTLDDLGDPDARHYLNFARDLTDRQFETPFEPRRRGGGFIRTDTPQGEAVVYSFAAPGKPQDSGMTEQTEACPTTYARYMVPSVVQLRLEGFYRWDDSVLRMIANGLAHYVFDGGGDPASLESLAAGVTGDETVEKIPATEYRDRLPVEQYAVSSLANLMPWDESGEIEAVSRSVYRQLEEDTDRPRRVQLPASFLLDARLDDGTSEE